MKYFPLKLILESERLLWIFLVFIIYSFYLPLSGYNFLVHDALNYFLYSSYFLSESGEFTLLNYSNSLRGYLFPLLLLPLKNISDLTQTSPIYYTRLLGATCAGILFGYAIPELWQIINKTKLEWPRRAAFIIITFLLWRDYFNFSLTDFPAILSLIVSLILIYKNQNWFFYLFAGIFLGGAINMRPLYLIVLPVYILALVFNNKNKIKVLAGILVFTFGLGLISLPQFLINIRYFNSFSPFVTANYYQNENLYLHQLNWGIQNQKYETSIDTSYSSPRMYFLDKAGISLLKNQNIKGFYNYIAYVRLVWQKPDYFLISYCKHFFNGLDLQYTTPYIKNVFYFNWFLTWLNYTILFLGIILLKFCWNLSFNKRHYTIFIISLLPCLVVIPVAIECRFMLPLHLLCYTGVCFGWPNQWRWKYISEKVKVRVSLFYIFFIAICYWLSFTTQITLEYVPRLFWQ